MIAIGLSPNTQRDDVLLVLRVLLSPWLWFRGEAIKYLEEYFKRAFQVRFATAFDSGRSCEYAILRTLGVGIGDEVLLQAFTCVAVPNSVMWAGATPVYVDVDDTGNLDPRDLERKITKRSKAIIVQHTFGTPADMEKMQTIAKKHNLFLIEDCAHALGGKYNGKRLGTFGDFAFFSFGRDKVISSVFGGMVITNSKRYGHALRNFQRNLPHPPASWVFAQLFHPIAFAFLLPIYNLFIGKILLVFFQKVRMLSMPVDAIEKKGGRPPWYPRRLPNAQAQLALHQLRKLVAFNSKRGVIANMYERELKTLPVTLPKYVDGSVFLRYNIQTAKASSIYSFFKERGILLGRWYSHVIDPGDVDVARIGYKNGSCPRAELLARWSLNLPTYPRMSMEDAKDVIKILKEYYHGKR